MKMTTRVAYCNMRHYKSKNILIGIAIILTTLLLSNMACPLSERGREYSYETGGTS